MYNHIFSITFKTLDKLHVADISIIHRDTVCSVDVCILHSYGTIEIIYSDDNVDLINWNILNIISNLINQKIGIDIITSTCKELNILKNNIFNMAKENERLINYTNKSYYDLFNI
jgi:transposase